MPNHLVVLLPTVRLEPRFQDRLGLRLVRYDSSGEAMEAFRPSAEIAAMRESINERVQRLAQFRQARFVPVRGVDAAPDDPSTVEILSDHVPGVRLAVILDAADKGQIVIETGTALHIVRELLAALALLHESRGVTHGAIGPERILVTPGGRVMVADYVLGLALERLRVSRSRLWSEFRIPMPANGARASFDVRADIAQIGVVAVALLLGRPLDTKEYPRGILDLVGSLTVTVDAGRRQPLPAALKTWLKKVLGIEAHPQFVAAREAQMALETALSKKPGLQAAANQLKRLVDACDPSPREEDAPADVPCEQIDLNPVAEVQRRPIFRSEDLSRLGDKRPRSEPDLAQAATSAVVRSANERSDDDPLLVVPAAADLSQRDVDIRAVVLACADRLIEEWPATGQIFLSNGGEEAVGQAAIDLSDAGPTPASFAELPPIEVVPPFNPPLYELVAPAEVAVVERPPIEVVPPFNPPLHELAAPAEVAVVEHPPIEVVPPFNSPLHELVAPAEVAVADGAREASVTWAEEPNPAELHLSNAPAEHRSLTEPLSHGSSVEGVDTPAVLTASDANFSAGREPAEQVLTDLLLSIVLEDGDARGFDAQASAALEHPDRPTHAVAVSRRQPLSPQAPPVVTPPVASPVTPHLATPPARPVRTFPLVPQSPSTPPGGQMTAMPLDAQGPATPWLPQRRATQGIATSREARDPATLGRREARPRTNIVGANARALGRSAGTAVRGVGAFAWLIVLGLVHAFTFAGRSVALAARGFERAFLGAARGFTVGAARLTGAIGSGVLTAFALAWHATAWLVAWVARAVRDACALAWHASARLVAWVAWMVPVVGRAGLNALALCARAAARASRAGGAIVFGAFTAAARVGGRAGRVIAAAGLKGLAQGGTLAGRALRTAGSAGLAGGVWLWRLVVSLASLLRVAGGRGAGAIRASAPHTPRRGFLMPRSQYLLAGLMVPLALQGLEVARERWFSPDLQVGTLRIDSKPGGLLVRIDGVSHGAGPFSATLAAGRHRLEFAGWGFSRARDIVVAAGQDTVVATRHAASWTGTLRVESQPDGAEVLVDGAHKGRAPLTLDGVTAGNHFVLVRGASGSVSRTVSVKADEVVEVMMPIYSGWIAVFAPVELNIIDQGRVIGTTESGHILVQPGEHTLELVSDRLGFRTERKVVVMPGEVAAVNMELPPVSIEVVAPSGSEIRIDGQLIGTAPLEPIEVAVGIREVTMRHPSLGEQRQTATITYRSPNKVVFEPIR